MKNVKMSLLFTLLFFTLLCSSQRNIKSESINYLIEHSQSKIIYKDCIYLFNGWYYPEIWKIKVNDNRPTLLTKKILETEEDWTPGWFQLFNNYDKINDIYIFYQEHQSIISLFCPKTDSLETVSEHTGCYLCKSQKKLNSFYITHLSGEEGSPIEKITYDENKNMVDTEIVGHYNIATAKYRFNSILPNIEKERILNKLKLVKKNYDSLHSIYGYKIETLKQINNFSELKIDNCKYYVVGTMPLTVLKVINNKIQYHVHDNYEYPIMPYKMEYDELHNNILLYSYRNFDKKVKMILNLDKEEFF